MFGALTTPSLADRKSPDLGAATVRALLAIDPGLSNGIAILDQRADLRAEAALLGAYYVERSRAAA